MYGCDNTPELRARLRPSAKHDTERKRLHDFNNLLAELVFAVQLEEAGLMTHYLGELRGQFAAAVKEG